MISSDLVICVELRRCNCVDAAPRDTLFQTEKWKIGGSSYSTRNSSASDPSFNSETHHFSSLFLNQDMLAIIQVVLLLMRNHWRYVTHVFSQPHRLHYPCLPIILSLLYSVPAAVPAAPSKTSGPCCAVRQHTCMHMQSGYTQLEHDQSSVHLGSRG